MFLTYSMLLAFVCLVLSLIGREALRRYRVWKRAKNAPKISKIVGVVRSFQKAFAFLVEIDGFLGMGFSKVEGLYWARDAEGQSLDFYNRITLTRGLVSYPKDPNEMQLWFGAAEPRNVSIVFLNRDGNVTSRLFLGKCKPVTYYLSDPDNGADENVCESIELVRTESISPSTV